MSKHQIIEWVLINKVNGFKQKQRNKPQNKNIKTQQTKVQKNKHNRTYKK